MAGLYWEMHNDVDKGYNGRGIPGHLSIGRCQIREVKFTAQVDCTASLPGYLKLVYNQFTSNFGVFCSSKHTLLCHHFKEGCTSVYTLVVNSCVFISCRVNIFYIWVHCFSSHQKDCGECKFGKQKQKKENYFIWICRKLGFCWNTRCNLNFPMEKRDSWNHSVILKKVEFSDNRFLLLPVASLMVLSICKKKMKWSWSWNNFPGHGNVSGWMSNIFVCLYILGPIW